MPTPIFRCAAMPLSPYARLLLCRRCHASYYYADAYAAAITPPDYADSLPRRLRCFRRCADTPLLLPLPICYAVIFRRCCYATFGSYAVAMLLFLRLRVAAADAADADMRAAAAFFAADHMPALLPCFAAIRH